MERMIHSSTFAKGIYLFVRPFIYLYSHSSSLPFIPLLSTSSLNPFSFFQFILPPLSLCPAFLPFCFHASLHSSLFLFCVSLLCLLSLSSLSPFLIPLCSFLSSLYFPYLSPFQSYIPMRLQFHYLSNVSQIYIMSIPPSLIPFPPK